MLKKTIIGLSLLCSFSARAQMKPYINPTNDNYIKVKGLGMNEVTWTNNFWKERFDLAQTNVIPAEWSYFMDFTEDNFKIEAGKLRSKIGFQGTNWQDGDYYKWLEAQIAAYAVTKDKALLKEIQRRAHLIADAQAEDGYYTLHTQIGYGLMGPNTAHLKKFKHPKRFKTLRYHETYNMGHLMTLATTHYRVTGDSTLLKVAMKAGYFLNHKFPKADKTTSKMDFNSTQIMGLMELYRSTQDSTFLNLANRFISAKGHGADAMNQDATLLREERDAVGHAVLATVLYSGAADYVAETGDKKLLSSLISIWDDIYNRKASLTGGIGNVHNGISPTNRNMTVQEAFSSPYRLKNSTAYNETCANFYGAFFSWRMFLLTGDVKYVNKMETAFYNNLSAMSLDGKSYFYTNPLRWYGKEHELRSLDHYQRWTNEETCVCCPTSVARFLTETNNYAYAKNNDSLYAILYGSSLMSTKINNKRVTFKQSTNYPIDGDVSFVYSGELENLFSLNLRIPEWATNAYYTINGNRHNVSAGSFATIRKYWKQGDQVELHLNMRPRVIQANPLVESLRNQGAIAYGPMIYCAEQNEEIQPNIDLKRILIPRSPEFNVSFQKDLLGGVNQITIKNAYLRRECKQKEMLYRDINAQLNKTTLKLVPYYTWANRGVSSMSVFLPFK